MCCAQWDICGHLSLSCVTHCLGIGELPTGMPYFLLLQWDALHQSTMTHCTTNNNSRHRTKILWVTLQLLFQIALNLVKCSVKCGAAVRHCYRLLAQHLVFNKKREFEDLLFLSVCQIPHFKLCPSWLKANLCDDHTVIWDKWSGTKCELLQKESNDKRSVTISLHLDLQLKGLSWKIAPSFSVFEYSHMTSTGPYF